MVKTRLIPVLNIKNGLIVRSEDFSYHQNIGNVVNEAERYNQWDVDELICLDISRSSDYDLRRDDHKISSYSNFEESFSALSKVCFMPLAIGGGIRSLEDIDYRIRAGADKVVLNTGVFEDPDLLRKGAEKYGSQAMVVCIDYRVVNGKAVLFVNFGSKDTGVEMTDWIREVERLGAGEIFLHSIERDGKANGFDIENIGIACNTTRLPIIGAGGAGDFYDFVDLAKETRVSAIAAGNIFHFSERSYPRAKQLLKKNGINVR